MQLVSPLTEMAGSVVSSNATAAPTRATDYNPGWLVAGLANVQQPERPAPLAFPVADPTAYAASDALFGHDLLADDLGLTL